MRYQIQFFSEGIPFVLKNKSLIRKWLNEVIRQEGKKPWYINFIFCSDDYLFELNKTYLHHLTLTDIITFPYWEENTETVSGDVFISVDRVRENALLYKQEFELELKRVMVHGILHLSGYSDKGKREKEAMTEKEDFYLAKY